MPDLPARPDLDQLRRQARDLLRAAAGGEPAALSRIRAFSRELSLSAAQLSVAREHGFASWPALHAEVQRRLAVQADTENADARWSFGAAGPVETPAGTLHPGILVAGADYAVLDAQLVPGDGRQRRAAPPRDAAARAAWTQAAGSAMHDLTTAVSAAIALSDDRGTAYGVRVQSASGGTGRQRGGVPGLVSVSLTVDPVPGRDRRWLELRGQDGSAVRLLPSARADTHVGAVVPVPDSASAALADQATWLIDRYLAGAGQDALARACSRALARVAELRQSGTPEPGADLAGQLTRLCGFLAGHDPADGLPRGWTAMLDAAGRGDGPPLHLDIAAVLPVEEGVVRADSLVSEPGSWRVFLRAEPGWWLYSDDGHHKQAVVSVRAEDDLGGMYVSQFGGSHPHGGREEVTLRFLPRLSPLARAVTLTFAGTGDQVSLEVRLPSAAR